MGVALTGVAQLVGHHPARQKAASSIPQWGTCLGCGFSPWRGHIQEAANQCFSPPLSLSLPLQKQIKSFLKKLEQSLSKETVHSDIGPI